MEESRKKDELIVKLLDKLGNNQASFSNAEIPLPDSFQIMPDLSKGIEIFDDEKDRFAAKEWLSNVNGMILLHCWPASFALETA